jgi:hypothetical protein
MFASFCKNKGRRFYKAKPAWLAISGHPTVFRRQLIFPIWDLRWLGCSKTQIERFLTPSGAIRQTYGFLKNRRFRRVEPFGGSADNDSGRSGRSGPASGSVEPLLFRFDLGAFPFDSFYITQVCQVCLNKSATTTNIFIQFD